MIIHKELFESGRWYTLTIAEQLANVGADIDRAISWKKKGNFEMSAKAFERALELLDFTIRDSKNRGPRLGELCRTREALVDHFVYDNEYNTTDEQWHKYFFAFNYAASQEKGR